MAAAATASTETDVIVHRSSAESRARSPAPSSNLFLFSTACRSAAPGRFRGGDRLFLPRLGLGQTPLGRRRPSRPRTACFRAYRRRLAPGGAPVTPTSRSSADLRFCAASPIAPRLSCTGWRAVVDAKVLTWRKVYEVWPLHMARSIHQARFAFMNTTQPGA